MPSIAEEIRQARIDRENRITFCKWFAVVLMLPFAGIALIIAIACVLTVVEYFR